MKKECVNKLECRFPTLFKLMWLSTIVWIVIGVINYFGHWLLPNKLDGFGISILIMFAISLFICFGKGIANLISQHNVLSVDITTRKVASVVFLASFAIMLILSIWDICGANENHSEFTRNGTWGAPDTLFEGIYAMIANVIKATIISIVGTIFYLYVRMCFVLFYGRIRRIGVEIALALMMLAYLAAFHNNQLWVNAIVVLIAGVFLFDIWCFADFKEEQISWDKIKEVVTEED